MMPIPKGLIATEADLLIKESMTVLAQEVRKALAGREGYTSSLPPVRTSAAGRAARRRGGRQATRRAWRVVNVRRGGEPLVGIRPARKGERGHKAGRLAALLELNKEIRGYLNVWADAIVFTVDRNWRRMDSRVARRAPERVKEKIVRRHQIRMKF